MTINYDLLPTIVVGAAFGLYLVNFIGLMLELVIAWLTYGILSLMEKFGRRI